MKKWNRYCDVNWSAYRFQKLHFGKVDPSSISINNFYIDIDVYQQGEKSNAESAPALERYLESKDTRRLAVKTPHGFNFYVKAPPGCGIPHVQNLYKFLHGIGVDADPCMINPVAQRKAINSYCHDAGEFVVPLTASEVLGDLDDIDASRPRLPVKDYWRGNNHMSVGDVSTRVHDEVGNVKGVDVAKLCWPVPAEKICPVVAYVLQKQVVGYFERVDLCVYFRAVCGVPPGKIQEFITGAMGEKRWKKMSGWKRVMLVACKENLRFHPRRFKTAGYCPPGCFRCMEMQDEREEMMLACNF